MKTSELLMRSLNNAVAYMHRYDWRPELLKALRQDILEVVDFKDCKLCLEVAAGTGRLTRLLRKCIADDAFIVALDHAILMLCSARDHMDAGADSFVCADAHNLPFDGSRQKFDVILCAHALGQFVDPPKVFRNWFDVLATAGQVVIIDGLSSPKQGDPPHLAQLPLSYLQNTAIVTDLLQEAGFHVQSRKMMRRFNSYARKLDRSVKAGRFIVTAGKS